MTQAIISSIVLFLTLLFTAASIISVLNITISKNIQGEEQDNMDLVIRVIAMMLWSVLWFICHKQYIYMNTVYKFEYPDRGIVQYKILISHNDYLQAKNIADENE